MHSAIDLLLTTAQTHAQAGRAREAALACEQVLKREPQNPRALFLLGYLLHQAGQWQPALQRLTQAAAANPAGPESHFLIGLIHQQQRNLPAAITAYKQAVRLHPKHFKALNNLGRALLDHGQLVEGIDVLKRVVASDPQNVGALSNLGDGLRMSGDLDGAVAAQQRAIEVDPDSAEAHSNLGSALAHQGKNTAAIASMRQAIALNPRLATPHYNLARVLSDQNRTDEAIGYLQSALALRPQYPDALNLLGNLMGIIGDVSQAISAHRAAVAARPEWAATHSNLLLSLHYVDDLSPEQVFQAHLDWARRHGDSNVVSGSWEYLRTGSGDQRADRRLRIGYVSPNFSNHSVAYFFEPVLAATDREAFEIFCYAHLRLADETTVRFQSLAEHWRDITKKSDAEVIEMIKRDEIDILVDLAGHTADNHMKVFAAKPAPVQVSWLGYPDTTGLATMDYRITDAIADPPGQADQLHTEKLIRVDGGCWAFQPPAKSPDVAPAPAPINEFVTFGSFNNLPKVTPAVLKAWTEILHAVPNSRLLIKALGLSSELARRHISEQFTAAGVDASRLDLRGWASEITSHLELYHYVDIALDTFPYNGTTTTCESLWMGVPVISFAGRTHAGRVGASLLTHAGFAEFLAQDRDDYIAKAILLASDIERLSFLRDEVRQRFAASPVCDGRRLCRALEKAFREMSPTLGRRNNVG